MKKLWLGVMTIGLLAACSSDEISKSDVQKALDSAGALNQICVPFQLNIDTHASTSLVAQEMLGADEVRLLKRKPDGKRANLDAIDQMEILVDAGIYHAAEIQHEGEGEHTIRYVTYRLTDKGQQSFMRSPHGALLCIGQQEVEKIRFYTEPTAANGITISQVSYQANVDSERWAKKLLRDNPYYAGLKKPFNQTITLVKTNEGWRDIRQIRQAAFR